MLLESLHQAGAETETGTETGTEIGTEIGTGESARGVILLKGGSQTTRYDTDHEPVFRQEGIIPAADLERNEHAVVG